MATEKIIELMRKINNQFDKLIEAEKRETEIIKNQIKLHNI